MNIFKSLNKYSLIAGLLSIFLIGFSLGYLSGSESASKEISAVRDHAYAELRNEREMSARQKELMLENHRKDIFSITKRLEGLTIKVDRCLGDRK